MDGSSSSVKFTHQDLIEVLVLLTAMLMVVRYMLDVMFGSKFSNQNFLFLLNMLAALPYALHTYTIGIMQLTKSNNDVYQVWAVVLVTLQYSIRAVRPTGIFVKQSPLQDMMSSLWTANLLGTRTTLLKIPLWLLWTLNSVRFILGFADTELTSSRQGTHLMMLTEYMRTEHEHYPLEDCDVTRMKGYKYLVQGENKQKIESDPPEYRVRLEVTKEKKFITTNKVWERNGALLGEPSESNELKDLCLAFALSKLLHRRFFGLPIHEANQKKSEVLVLKGLIKNGNYDRAFQIIEAELAFGYDYFYTRYAIMFARGFPFLRLVLSLSVIGVASYLAVIFYHSSGRLAGDLSKTTNGIAVTWTLLVILAIKEIWEMATYVMSDWTKVVLISSYVQQPMWTRCPPIVASMKFLCKKKIANRWHGILWQYNILQSFRYRPYLNALCTWIFRVYFNRVLRKQFPGYKGSPPIALPVGVKSAICKSLQGFCNQPEDMEKYLSRVANSLHPDLKKKIPQTSKFATETQKILVWHMATCYCEIKLAKTSQNTGSQSEYKVATALSQYSAHLLTQQSPLLPDRSMVATQLFSTTVWTTRKLLGSCKSWNDVMEKLDNLAKENDDGGGGGGTDDDKDERPNLSKWEKKKRQNKRQEIREKMRKKRHERSRIITDKIIEVGMKLGGSLLELLVENENKNETCVDTKLWEFLEKFWTRYLLHLAASVSPARHKQSLSEGGQFLTHVWALLLHAGLLGKTEQNPCLLSLRDL